jgi:NADH-quinone oxidoreductase subunit C
MELTNELVLEAISREFPEAVLNSSEPYGLLTIELKKEETKKVIHYLKESSYEFIFLTDICGVHYPDNQEKELGVVYHLHSLVNNFRLRLKTFMPRESAAIETISDLYSGANWMERETFDFYGIQFVGHPDLRRILNMDDMDYHPLRKQYALEDETRTDKNDTFFGR